MPAKVRPSAHHCSVAVIFHGPEWVVRRASLLLEEIPAGSSPHADVARALALKARALRSHSWMADAYAVASIHDAHVNAIEEARANGAKGGPSTKPGKPADLTIRTHLGLMREHTDYHDDFLSEKQATGLYKKFLIARTGCTAQTAGRWIANALKKRT